MPDGALARSSYNGPVGWRRCGEPEKMLYARPRNWGVMIGLCAAFAHAAAAASIAVDAAPVPRIDAEVPTSVSTVALVEFTEDLFVAMIDRGSSVPDSPLIDPPLLAGSTLYVVLSARDVIDSWSEHPLAWLFERRSFTRLPTTRWRFDWLGQGPASLEQVLRVEPGILGHHDSAGSAYPANDVLNLELRMQRVSDGKRSPPPRATDAGRSSRRIARIYAEPDAGQPHVAERPASTSPFSSRHVVVRRGGVGGWPTGLIVVIWVTISLFAYAWWRLATGR